MNNDAENQQQSIFLLGLFLLFVLIYIVPLGNPSLAIPDETRYAEVPYEMLVSGDWITPRLNDLRYFEKPPLGYWLNAISISLFGENAFAVVYAVGTFSVLDSLLTLLLTAGIISFYLAVREQRQKMAWWYWTASGLSLGLAFLTKGFLAFAIPVLVLVPWLLWHRHWRVLLVQGWYVILVAVLVVLPWGILIHQRESDFWHYFFWIEHIKRFTADNAQHKAPFYYFLMYLPVLAFPWISLAPAAIAGLKKINNNREITRFLWLWLLLPFLFFSTSSGKLATYILPCFPPLAILTAIGLSQYLQVKNTRLFSGGVLFNLFLLCSFLLVLLISQNFDVGFVVYKPEEMGSLIILVIALLIGIIGSLIAYKSKSANIRLISVALLIVPLVGFMHFAIPNLARESKLPGAFLSESRQLIDSNTIVISDASMLRAVNWYLKRKDVYLIETGELTYGLSYPDAANRFVTPKKFTAFLAKKKEHPIAVFCRKTCPEPILKKLPQNAQKRSYGKFKFWYIN